MEIKVYKTPNHNGYCNDKTLRRGAYMKRKTLEQCAETCKNQDYDNITKPTPATVATRPRNASARPGSQTHSAVLPVRLRERVAGVEDNSLPKGCVYDRRAERTGVEHPLRKNRRVGAF